MIRLAFLIPVVLAGCASQKGDASFAAPVAADYAPALKEITTHQDQTSQNLTGLGAQIREVNADLAAVKGDVAAVKGDVTGIKGDVSAFKAQIGSMTAEVTMSNNALVKTGGDLALLKGDISGLKTQIGEVRASLDANIEANLRAEMRDLKAQVSALASAQVQAVAGFGNKLDETVKTLTATAGRDVNTTEFTKEMASVFEKAYSSMVTVVYIAGGVLVSVLGGGTLFVWRTKEGSRAREAERVARKEEENKRLLSHLMAKGGTL
jgi:archaellum component FlaC